MIYQYIQLFQTDPALAIVLILSVLLGFLIAISFHEWAHAYSAYKLGDPTAKNLGRMSLDPTRHIDWTGALFFLFFGIGWAKPVVVNSGHLKKPRRDDIIISAAGAITNFLISFIMYGVLVFLPASSSTTMNMLDTVIVTICTMNMSFALFNLIPLPPLDGFHVLSNLLPYNSKVLEFLHKYGNLILMIWIFIDFIPGLEVISMSNLLGYVANWFFSLFGKFFGLFV